MRRGCKRTGPYQCGLPLVRANCREPANAGHGHLGDKRHVIFDGDLCDQRSPRGGTILLVCKACHALLADNVLRRPRKDDGGASLPLADVDPHDTIYYIVAAWHCEQRARGATGLQLAPGLQRGIQSLDDGYNAVTGHCLVTCRARKQLPQTTTPRSPQRRTGGQRLMTHRS